MGGRAAVRSVGITPLPRTARRSTARSPLIKVRVIAQRAAMDQIGEAVSDRGGEQQRRCRVLMDRARRVLAGTPALIVYRLRRRAGLSAGTVRQILGRLADFSHR